MKASAGKRVLMLLENNPYPQDLRVRQAAATLKAAGIEVSVIAPASRGQPRRENVNDVHVYRYRAPASGSGMLGYVWEYGYSITATFLLSLVVFTRRGFDVVHAHNPPDFYVLIGAFYKLFRKRFVFDHHDLSPEMYQARFQGGNRSVYKLLVFFEKLTFRLADHVIATNDSYKAVAMERGNVPAERISVVRNGPQLDRVRRVEPDANLEGAAGTVIGYVGVLGYQDGVDYLLRALKHLRDDLQRSDFYCVIIGKGDARKSLMSLARALKLDGHVWFTGYVSETDLWKYLSTADIFVDADPSNPFNDRSTMIKMMEYMALERPIVAFDLPEHRVTAGDAALYAQANDELDFAKRINQLMDDPRRREEMGRRGRRRVEGQLAWPHQEKHLIEAYQRLGLCAVKKSEGRTLKTVEG